MGDRHLHDQEKQEEKTMIALVDCNNFYASCERAFNPNWNNRPVVVLSNNDGCVIARSSASLSDQERDRAVWYWRVLIQLYVVWGYVQPGNDNAFLLFSKH